MPWRGEEVRIVKVNRGKAAFGSGADGCDQK